MAYGNNRAASRPRAIFQTAGGSIIRFRHPFLSGQILNAPTIDEIDVSACLRLNDTYLSSEPNQDSAYQETLIDGSTITITNHLLACTVKLNVLPGSGVVAEGDFIAALQLIKASKDDVGGTLTRIKFVNGRSLVKVWYGVSIKRVPDDIEAGNSVPVYPVELLASGWVEGIGPAGTTNERTIWAVGSKYGLKGVYAPYGIQGAEARGEGRPLGVELGLDAGEVDNGRTDKDVVSATPPAGGYPNVTSPTRPPDPSGWVR